MVERLGKGRDPFEKLRTVDENHWLIVKSSVSNVFDGKIPKKIEPHLIEYAVIRGRAYNRTIDREEFEKLRKEYGQVHDKCFELKNFIPAIEVISNRYPVAA